MVSWKGANQTNVPVFALFLPYYFWRALVFGSVGTCPQQRKAKEKQNRISSDVSYSIVRAEEVVFVV